MYRLAFGLLFLAVAACTTAPKTIESPQVIPGAPAAKDEVSIDYIGLQRSLGMDIPVDKLGYMEKAFNTCQVGYGYSSTHNCYREFMVVINFRLQCRDSEGTVAEGVTNADITPISDRPIRWTLKGTQGATKTDSEGFGQIMMVSGRSPKKERLKIATGNEFLYMRANEITRVVTPRPWCNP